MTRFVLILLVMGVVGSLAQQKAWEPSPGLKQIRIWPGAVPDAGKQPTNGPESVVTSETKDGQTWLAAVNVTQPTLTVYSPKGTNTAAAVVVFPGGGYECLAMDLEGTEICDWLNGMGITAVLLKYRVPVTKGPPYFESEAALQDAQRAISLVRSRAKEWEIDPGRIGVIGFSAGGHLVAATSTRFDKRSYTAVDAVDQANCRPDFAISLYPGHLLRHAGPLKLNPNITVTTNTPPTFLAHAEDDPVDSVLESVVYYIELKKAGVPTEMHLYAKGGHAFGLRHPEMPIGDWPKLAEKWMRAGGVMGR